MPTSLASMFEGSSNITIQGGTFIVINGNISQADTASQSTEAVGTENHNCRSYVPDTEPFSARFPSWEANAQNYSEPETYPTTVGCHCPVHDPCIMLIPTISSEGSMRDEIMSTPTPMSVDGSRRSTTPNNDSHPSIPKARLFLEATIRHARKILSNFSRA